MIINVKLKHKIVYGDSCMKSKDKKMIAPIIISVIVVGYYILYFAILLSLLDGISRFVFGIIPIILSIVMIRVCIERINEIKGGEEDDISKY